MSDPMTRERLDELRQIAAVHPKGSMLDECLDEIERLLKIQAEEKAKADSVQASVSELYTEVMELKKAMGLL